MTTAPPVWTESAWQQLATARERDRLPHALLLAGPAGVGKRQFAAALTAWLLCEEPGTSACGQCRGCQLLQAGSHPDDHLLAPEERGKLIRVDAVREAIEVLGQTAGRGRYRVLRIQPAEAMNVNAANALLKCLEEPGADTLLLLVADAPARLLPTLRSRCQRLSFPVPDTAETHPWLAAAVGDPTRASELLAMTGDRPVAALELWESGAMEQRGIWAEGLNQLLAGKMPATQLAEQWLETDIEALTGWLHADLLAATRRRMGVATGAGPAAQWPAQAPAPSLLRLLETVQEAQNQTRPGANPNRQLLLESLLLACCELVHG